MKETPDDILFEKLRQGNEKAFDVLFFRYYPWLCAYAKPYVGLAESEEIVQDMMVWLWENRETHILHTSLRAYLFQSVRNRCITHITRTEHRKELIINFHSRFQPEEDPNFYILEELTQNLEEALKRLPESYRQAFELNRFYGKTYQEIAEELQVSPKTIDYRIQQALKQLRKDLKDYLPLLIFFLYE